MTEGLFLIDKNSAPKRIQPSSFTSENEFQSLVAKFPELLTDADFGEGSPRRWLLITREAMVPDKSDGSGRWSLDHLFLDQDGVPTLVELKRASDTRGRREVVAQMLDYAANAVNWWKAEKIAEWLDERCRDEGLGSARALLREKLGIDESNMEAFWRNVRANLGSRRIRMVFVADRIERELETIVSFLNEQMKDATVVALELAQFSDGTSRVLAPRLIGLTPQSIAQKSITAPIPESLDDWLNSVAQSSALPTARRFIDLMSALGWKPRTTRRSIAFDVDIGERIIAPVLLRANGKIGISFYMLAKAPAFQTETARKSLSNEFDRAGFKLSVETIANDASFSAPPLTDSESWDKLRELLGEVLHQLAEPLPAP